MARILVIDDDLDLLEMTRMMLQRGGHEAILTGDGMDGIAKAQQLHPDLAIVDVMMPGMNGYQVVRKLREGPGDRRYGDSHFDCSRPIGRPRCGVGGSRRCLHGQAGLSG